MDNISGPPSLKILSYNIHKGFSLGNRKFVLEEMRKILEIVDADFVFLQEVLGAHTQHAARVADWPAEPQFEYLADKLWPHFAYGKNAVYSAGHHGNAILSKHGFQSFENIDVSTNVLERRGLLHAVTKIPGCSQDIHLICLHLDLRESGRRKQVQTLLDRVKSEIPADSPLIVAGDFNDWRHRCGKMIESNLGLKEAHLAVHGHYARSFPSRFPVLRLDRIYSRRFHARNAQALSGQPWNTLSDHTPLFAELVLV